MNFLELSLDAVPRINLHRFEKLPSPIGLLLSSCRRHVLYDVLLAEIHPESQYRHLCTMETDVLNGCCQKRSILFSEAEDLKAQES